MTSNPTVNNSATPESLCRFVVVEDDRTTSTLLKATLQKAGYHVDVADSGENARKFYDQNIAVFILDIGLPDVSGLTLLEEIQDMVPDSVCVMLSGSDELDHVLTALSNGAFWYLKKPVDTKEFLGIAERAYQNAILVKQQKSLNHPTADLPPLTSLTGKSSIEKVLYDEIATVAQTGRSCLITGDRGTGKGLIARIIHAMSERSRKPFLSVSCATTPRDQLIEELSRIPLAHGGSFLFDDIEYLPMDAQSQIIGLLKQEQERCMHGGTAAIDVRIIGTSCSDLGREVKRRRFSSELYSLLSVRTVTMPGLAERLDELPHFIDFLLSRITKRRGEKNYSVSPEAMILLLKHSWPGNFRELERLLELAVFLCEDNRIGPQDLKFSEVNQVGGVFLSRFTDDVVLPLWQVEKLAIEKAIAACGGNKAKAARLLEISEKSIYNKMKRLKIEDMAVNS